jgi:DDE family transposase
MSKNKSSRSTRIPRRRVEELTKPLETDEGWEKLRKRLPEALDTLAEQSGAVKRWRKLRRASDLLRLALLYGFASMGLYTLVCWAARAGLVRFSAEALGYRLSRSVHFLGQILGYLLQSQLGVATPKSGARIVRIVLNDASVLTLPGSVGTDLRMHTHFELPQQRLSAVRVTGPEVGERLDVVESPSEAVVVGDMGLGRASGLHAEATRGAWPLTRVHFQSIRLEAKAGVGVDIEQILERADRGECSTSVLVPLSGHEPLQARLLVRPLRPEAAARARQKLLRSASKKCKEAPNALALRLAGYLCLLTTAPQELLSDEDAFRLYRLRWQIELAFKRYKSLLGLNKLRKANDPLLSVQILAKLIVITLVEQLIAAQMPLLLTKSPETLCAEALATRRPEPSLWRLTHLASIAMFGFLAGPSTWWYGCSSQDADLMCEGKRRRRTSHNEIVTLAEKFQNPQINEFMKKIA